MLIPDTFAEFKTVFLQSLSRMPRSGRYYLPRGFSISSPHEDEPHKRYFPRYFDRYGNLYDDTLIEYSRSIRGKKGIFYLRRIDPDLNLMDVTVTNAVMRRIWRYLRGVDTLFECPPVHIREKPESFFNGFKTPLNRHLL